LNEKLDGPLSNDFKNTILQIMEGFDTDKWLCKKCGNVRIEGDDISPEEAVAKLLEPCPHCGASGWLKHIVKGRYFS